MLEFISDVSYNGILCKNFDKTSMKGDMEVATYEKYAIDPNNIQTVVKNGVATGFEIKAKIPYYRGISLSLIEDVRIWLDGREFTRDRMTFTVGGETYTFDEMETMADLRWEYGEKATIYVDCPGGIFLGTHKVDIMIAIRVSYMGRTLQYKQSFFVCPMGG